MIFLLLSLCLVRTERVYSQNCVTMRYDEDGNRISMLVHQCGSEYKSQDQRIIADEEISINGNQELYVYPNPNEGVFVKSEVTVLTDFSIFPDGETKVITAAITDAAVTDNAHDFNISIIIRL